jgi:hypothetical protein
MKDLLKQLIPASTWSLLKKCKNNSFLPFRKIIEFAGYNIARKNDYYSPLPVVSELHKNVDRWYKPSRMVGIEFDITTFKSKLLSLISEYQDEFSKLPNYSEIHKHGFGPGYTALDAFILYMMIRDHKPRRYVEIGSGISTYYCSLAAEKNREEGFPLHIQCIEPNPHNNLFSIQGIDISPTEVQNIDISFFHQNLNENDILFIDSSHMLKIDSDVQFLVLEVLPSLNKGVLIHFHDIPFPYNFPYPPELWIFNRNWPLFWNEAMLLQSFLCFNNKFKITMSLPLIRYFDENFLRQNIYTYESIDQNPNTFSSIWLQKID